MDNHIQVHIFKPQRPEPAPEKKLTLFAFRLAMIEKSATGLGKLDFIWATVVLLGGFAITLEASDFWFITIILLSEGTRIFSRSHELEWQHKSTWSTGAKLVAKLLYCLQLLSAVACVVLSATKLVVRDFGEVEKGDTDKRNRKSALLIFYSLALFEAFLFLAEKAYWEWEVTVMKLLEQVSRECELGDSGLVSVRRFLYDAYSRCVDGCVFDGLKMDLVAFAMELIVSSSSDEELIGARILHELLTSSRYSGETDQKIGISSQVTEKLVEMLNWTASREVETRRCAAEIVSVLAGWKPICLRVASAPGSMDSISSLLRAKAGYCELNNLGLLILERLAQDNDACGKIGTARGLLCKIVDFAHAENELLATQGIPVDCRIHTVERALKVLKRLAGTGEQLRGEISGNVLAICNLRDIIKDGRNHSELQRIGIEVLAKLAMEECAAERIGGTGGVLKGLFGILFESCRCDGVRGAAGEAVAMLVAGSKENCKRVLEMEGVLGKLVSGLDEAMVRVNCAMILRDLCTFLLGGDEEFIELKGVITIVAPKIIKAIMSGGEDKLQEVMVGLAARVFELMEPQESSLVFSKAGVTERELAQTLVQILNKHQQPNIETPRMRRSVIELSIWMMGDKDSNVRVFRDLGFEGELEGVLETTGEIESYNMFSGAVGLSRHSTTMDSLVKTALTLLSQQ